MGLEKSHAKKEDPSVYKSGLLGILDKTEFTDQMRNSEACPPVVLDFKARKLIRDAMLEAEYRKAQAIALTRQLHYV